MTRARRSIRLTALWRWTASLSSSLPMAGARLRHAASAKRTFHEHRFGRRFGNWLFEVCAGARRAATLSGRLGAWFDTVNPLATSDNSPDVRRNREQVSKRSFGIKVCGPLIERPQQHM